MTAHLPDAVSVATRTTCDAPTADSHAGVVDAAPPCPSAKVARETAEDAGPPSINPDADERDAPTASRAAADGIPSPPSPGSHPGRGSISACIVCRNEADRLVRCLGSLGFVDEIVVMDLSSSDGSAELARRAGARVIVREPVPVVEWVRNEVADAACGEWILALDPDETVTPGLASELRRVAGRADVDAVWIPRTNYDLGYAPAAALHRYEQQLRMYRRAAVRWPTFPNALPEVPEARVHRIESRDDRVLRHDRSRTVAEVLERSVRYAPVQAQAMLDRGDRFTARAMLRALTRVAYVQVFRGEALRDGVPGLLRAGIIFGFHFYVWAAFWQLSGVGRRPADDRLLGRAGLVVEAVRRVLRLGRAVAARIPRGSR